MPRPKDPTSQLQVEKRAKWLRSEESGWTESLSLAMAMELANLLREKHLQLLLRPTFYKEVAAWIGELLKESRTET